MPKTLVLALVISATALAAVTSIGEVAGFLAPRTAQA
jgi:hypothetical protein